MKNNNKVITINKPFLTSVNAFKKFTLNLNIKRFTTDSNGQILAPGAIPVSEQKPFPFHLFSNWDKEGGYNIGDQIVSSINNTILFTYYVGGISTPLFFFNQFANINSEIKKGDVIFVYVDNLNNPNFFTFIIVQSINGGYASLISQSNISQIDNKGYWGEFKIFDVIYTWYNEAQLKHNIFLIKTKFNSAFSYDSVSPAMYYTPEQRTGNFKSRIPLNIILNQYVGISGFLDFENPLLNLSFEIYT